MVTIQQMQSGFARFVDTHIAGAYSGIEKALILGGASLLANAIPNIIQHYAQNPVFNALQVFDMNAGRFDIDTVYHAFVPHMGAEKIPVSLPKIGSLNLGTIKLGKDDIDALVRYIKEA